jgi:hypothetical protein
MTVVPMNKPSDMQNSLNDPQNVVKQFGSFALPAKYNFTEFRTNITVFWKNLLY